jgi:hypothetical protein
MSVQTLLCTAIWLNILKSLFQPLIRCNCFFMSIIQKGELRGNGRSPNLTVCRKPPCIMCMLIVCRASLSGKIYNYMHLNLSAISNSQCSFTIFNFWQWALIAWHNAFWIWLQFEKTDDLCMILLCLKAFSASHTSATLYPVWLWSHGRAICLW